MTSHSADPDAPREGGDSIELSADELDTLRSMVAQWVDEGFTTPPYHPDVYAVFRKIGLTRADVAYDITVPRDHAGGAEVPIDDPDADGVGYL